LHQRDKGALIYYVFDLPYLNNRDLSDTPLVERKDFLKELIQAHQSRIPSVLYSDHLVGSGAHFFKVACKRGLEGIVAKRINSPYVQKRSGYWVKVKCKSRQEFVVGGYTRPKGSRTFLGSPLLGYYARDKLIYCGHVGTGFSANSIKTVYQGLRELERDDSPFATPIENRLRRNVRWTSPEMVVEVEFSSWTEDQILRHPSFIGIREDKDPKTVILEREAHPAGRRTKHDSK